MSHEELFEAFIYWFRLATTRIPDHYIQVPVAGTDEKFLRERVYCYELYHQLRILLGDAFPCKLMGELDKERHPIIKPLIGAKEPDFVVHIPGDMENVAIMEVKAITRDDKNRVKEERILLDTDKLVDFLRIQIKYYMAIQLLYGSANRDELLSVKRGVVERAGAAAGKILLYWHPGVGIMAEEI